MTQPFFTTCLKCHTSYDHEVPFCTHCATDEWLIDEPFEDKDRSR